jgi:uncharacterized protein YciI
LQADGQALDTYRGLCLPLLAVGTSADYDTTWENCLSESESHIMRFAAIIEYTSDKAKIAEVRPTHRQYLTGLKDAGKLVAAGPFTDDSGALIVYEAPSREDAETLLKSDPFHKNGIFQTYQLRPWNPVFVNHDLLPK